MPIRNHAVHFEDDAVITTPMTFVMGKDDVLNPVELKLTIYHAFVSGKGKEIVGQIAINVAEYVGLPAEPRRYLLESKFNSTLRLTIHIQSLQPESTFKTPPINANQVLSDITEAIQAAPSLESVEEDESVRVKQSVPTVTVRSGHMSLRRAVNAHQQNLLRNKLKTIPLGEEEEEDDDDAADIVNKILASGALFEDPEE
jgi:hypothetical protein